LGNLSIEKGAVDLKTKQRKKEIYILGHKNPDTDSICASIAYAYLKNVMAQDLAEVYVYSPRRAGQLNLETEYVLKKFKWITPSYMDDVRPQVKDIDIRKVEGADQSISLKQAWSIMRAVDIATLPVLDANGKLEGLITIGDIARAYMAVFDNGILSDAKTPYANMIDALNANLLVGSPDKIVTHGKVMIAAANMDLIRKHVLEDDVVILGNRYEAQLCAIENKASCIIVCEGSPVSRTIKKLAEDNNCAVISTPHDTYTAARIINQSVPISYFMRKEGLVFFRSDDYISDIKGTMMSKHHRDFPVLSARDEFVGMISRRSLINMPLKRIILVDHNEADQAVDGIKDCEVLEIIDHHKLGTVETIKPIIVRNQPLGCTSTIIYQMFIENNIEIPKEIAGLLCSAIISDTLIYQSPTCTLIDRLAAEELAKIAGIETRQMAKDMFKAGSNLKDKSDEEIFYQDFKRFTAGDTAFGVGQITSMAQEELAEIKTRMKSYMERAIENHDVDILFFMLTNIIEKSTLLLFAGKNASEIAGQSFGINTDQKEIYLKDTVSRKKQLIPPLMATLQQ